MSNNAIYKIKQSLLEELNRIISLAKNVNLIVEIKLEPKQPLAMGNYEMVPDVREARESRFQFLTEKEIDDINIVMKSMGREGIVLNWIENTYLLCEKYEGSALPIGVISKDLYLKKIKPSKIESIENVNNSNKSVSDK